jgi:heterodisulfide reductase subunit A-like polyferredoxin
MKKGTSRSSIERWSMPEFITRKDKRKIENFERIGEDVELGKVVINREKCTGCGLCVKACAAATLEVVDKKCRMIEDRSFCVSCGDCAAICPEKAIDLVHFLEFKLFFRYLDRGKPEPPRRF